MSVAHVKFAALLQGSLWEYGLRFSLGGLATAATGVIADIWGPSIAGLFLAFPAIFVASDTMVARHEPRRKERYGLKGTARGRQAAALETRGVSLGCAAMFSFAVTVHFLAETGRAFALGAAAIV